MNPHILYWKWNDEILDSSVLTQKIDDIASRSNFTHVYVCLHSMSENYKLLCSDEILNAVELAKKLFTEKNIKLILDLDVTVENPKSIKCKQKSYQLSYGDFKLDSKGYGKINVPSDAKSVLKCYLVDFDDNHHFYNLSDITGISKVINGSLEIDLGDVAKDRSVIYYLKNEGNCFDLIGEEFKKDRLAVFERVKNIPLDGCATDEWGMGVKLDVELLEENLTSLDYLDINKANFFVERIVYTDGMNERYAKYYGESLEENIVYLRYIEKSNIKKSIITVNNYIENIKDAMVRAEEEFYHLTKKYFGENAFCGAHPTWWGDEIDNNFEGMTNGLDWWEVKRDYAQTDELILIPIRLAMARKCPKNIWYNMWYSMRTLDIKTYYTETWTNARYCGRTHYLGYECYEPGVVLNLSGKGLLEGVSKTEEKISILDEKQISSPDSRVLVIFGYEGATNWFLSDTMDKRLNRRGTVIHNVLKLTKELFEYPYLLELVPSYEINLGNVSVNNGKITYMNHAYDGAVMLYPDGVTKKVYKFLCDFDAVGNLIVVGNMNYFRDGEKFIEGYRFKHKMKNSAIDIANQLKTWKIPQNCGSDYCIYEDGSTVITTNGNKECGNGIKNSRFFINESNADIVFVDSSGMKTII